MKLTVPTGYTLTDVNFETGGKNVCDTGYKDVPKEVTSGSAEFCRRHNKGSLSGTNLRFVYKVNDTNPQVYLRGYVNNPYNDGGNQKSTVACDISRSDAVMAKAANNTPPTLDPDRTAPVGCFATWPGQPGAQVDKYALATISIVRPTVIPASITVRGTTHKDEAKVDDLRPELPVGRVYSVYGPDIPADARLTISEGGGSGTLSDVFENPLKAKGSTTAATLTLAGKTEADDALALMEKTCSFNVTGWVPSKDDLPRGQPNETAYVVGQDYSASPPRNGEIYVYSAEANEWLRTGFAGTPPGAGCEAGSAQTTALAGQQVLPAFLASPRLVGSTFCNGTQASTTFSQTWTRTATVSNTWGVEGSVNFEAGIEAAAKIKKFQFGWSLKIGASIGAHYERQWTRGEQYSVTVPLPLNPQEEGGVYVEPGNLVARADWLVANPPYNVPASGEGGPGTMYLLEGFVMYLPIANNQSVRTKTPQGTVEDIPHSRLNTASWHPPGGCHPAKQYTAGSPPPAGVKLTPTGQ